MNDQLLEHELRQAIGAHGAWKLKLSTAIATGRSTVTPEELSRDDCCAFGKWLAGSDLDAATRAGKPYQVVSRLHSEFHRAAGDVLAKALDGDEVGAQTLMDGAYKEKSAKLSAALSKWRTDVKMAAIRSGASTR